MSLEDSSLLIKLIIQTMDNKAGEHRGWILGMFLGILGASLLGNISARKRVVETCNGVAQTGDGVFRSGSDF